MNAFILQILTQEALRHDMTHQKPHNTVAGTNPSSPNFLN